MRVHRSIGLIALGVVVGATTWLSVVEARARQVPAPKARAAGPRPDLSGIWQAMTTANWDLQDHAAQQGPLVALGAAFSIPGGRGIVEGNEIPYQPWAAEQKKENGRNWLALDPEIRCYLPGTPRALYMPYPFQIVQTPRHILMAFEFGGATRTIYLDPNVKPAGDAGSDRQAPSWMGWSQGRWEGDALVVEVTDFNDRAWFDRAGNFHSDELHITERFRLIDHNLMRYEATIVDPKVFTRPWKISMPLYRRSEKNAELTEYKCVEFAEDVVYGQYYKVPPK